MLDTDVRLKFETAYIKSQIAAERSTGTKNCQSTKVTLIIYDLDIAKKKNCQPNPIASSIELSAPPSRASASVEIEKFVVNDKKYTGDEAMNTIELRILCGIMMFYPEHINIAMSDPLAHREVRVQDIRQVFANFKWHPVATGSPFLRLDSKNM
jgi:hypothetical protein